MSLNDEILRHQILLMRLVNTQAKNTKKYLKEAEKLILKAAHSGNFKSLSNDLKNTLDKMPKEALKIVKELAVYENTFTSKRIKKYKGRGKQLSKSRIDNTIENLKVSVSVPRPSQTIEDTYKSFTQAKTKQYVQAVRDWKVKEEPIDVLESRVSDLTRG
jgi:hypothetical protein